MRYAAIVFGLLFSTGEFLFAAPPKLVQVAPAEAGFDEAQLGEIAGVVEQALADKKLPGCVVAIGRNDRLVYCRAFGHRQVEPTVEPMTIDTIFDLASLTKPMATATSAMLLVERGRLRLDDPVAKHWPEFAAHGKDTITIEHLLIHTGGLIADNRLDDYRLGIDIAWDRLVALKPIAEPGERFVYSDVGFLTLGRVVERVSGQSLDRFAGEQIFERLGMSETRFRPPPEWKNRIAPADKRDGHFVRGEVHDPRSFLLGGVAGHAGLFSTASDVAKFAAMLAGRGRLGEVQLLTESTWSEMTHPRDIPKGQRALGWDVRTGYSTNRGATMSPRAFGHGGFTGTALWIDPDCRLFVIFLSNRLHPLGKGTVNSLAGEIGTIAAKALRE